VIYIYDHQMAPDSTVSTRTVAALISATEAFRDGQGSGGGF